MRVRRGRGSPASITDNNNKRRHLLPWLMLTRPSIVLHSSQPLLLPERLVSSPRYSSSPSRALETFEPPQTCHLCKMLLFIKMVPLLAALTSALASGVDPNTTTTTSLATPSTLRCRFGENRCDGTHTAVMVCGARGWLVAETCPKAGGCAVGRAGNAYCIRRLECRPGEWKCDASRYTTKFCNRRGLWETDRKCASPGCCEVQAHGRAVCKVECGLGLEPPGA
jgi:hypothetical protein